MLKKCSECGHRKSQTQSTYSKMDFRQKEKHPSLRKIPGARGPAFC